MINQGTVLQDRYLIEKLIGEGGMGAVYLATDQRFGNFVAIKVTFYKDDEFGEAFEREAKILNGLVHPVLPHVSDYFTEGDEHFLVMQFIDGEDVSEILKREGAFPVKDVLRWFDNLLEALDYLHSHEPPIIHRDLKPSNLKLTPRGDIFLLDFGLAKLKNENTLSERSVFGYSRRYSPLEQIQGVGTDVRSDLFALAATVYHLFTGKPPIDAIARASAIVYAKPDPIELASDVHEEIPVSIANVLNSALALNPENRFVSASAMRQALKHAVQGTAWENAEAAAVPQVLTEPEGIIIDSAENENFPALEAFAADLVDAPKETIDAQTESDEPNNIDEPEISAPENPIPTEQGKALRYAEVIAQVVKPVSPATKFPETSSQSSENNNFAGDAGGKNLTYAETIQQALKREVSAREEDVNNQAPVIPFVLPIENKVTDSPGTQHFQDAYSPENGEITELAASNEPVYAPEAVNADDQTRFDEPARAHPQASIAPAIMGFQKKADEDDPTVVAPRKNRSRSMAAALVAFLAIVATASAFFIFKNQNAGESDPTPANDAAVSEPAPNSNPPAVPEFAEAEVEAEAAPEAEETEDAVKIKTKPAPVKKNAEPAERSEREVEESISKELSHSNPKPPAKSMTNRAARKQNPASVNRRERVVESEPAPDIEYIFTGRTRWEREERMRRQEQRQRREEMSEEEWREMRRRRRQQRRQNNYPIPY